ncbi:MAG TPA: hypothetical protein VMZ91_13680 [Candidatus Paceibacterota bacterium]|nr:hypothetical protein [Candidatus Paceibacterota bacterium]
MKLKVPFVRNLKVWKGRGWCGPLVVACVLRYYGLKDSVPEIVKGVGTKLKVGTPPQGIINFCLNKRLTTIRLSETEFMRNNKKELSKKAKEFFTKHDIERREKKFLKKNRKFKYYKFIKKKPTLKDIEKFIKQRKPIIVTMNLAEIYNKDNFWPHYVVVVGSDKENIYIHNVYPKNNPYEKVKKKIFIESLTSQGLDGNLIIPHK